MTKAANLAALGSVVEAPTGSAPSFQCRAWVNFNGQGTPSIRGSGNVSSITDNSTGSFNINFTTAMPDTNYSCVGNCAAPVDTGGQQFGVYSASPASVNYSRVESRIVDNDAASMSLYDYDLYTFAIFR